MADDQTINIPQLVLVLVLGGLAVRYFFFSPAGTAPRAAARGTAASRVREEDVEHVMQMFPQADRRHVMWDLQRNGGSVAATTERILTGRALETPPQSFQPPMPVAATPSSAGNTTRTSATSANKQAAQPDLITRYNLASKLAASSTEGDAESKGAIGKQAWSANKTERQTLMQKRREEMILAARRKMEAKLAAEAAQGKA